jgi:hypothetical protein
VRLIACAGLKLDSGQLLLISIFFCAFTISGRFGSVMVSTPLSKRASAFSSSTVSGSRIERWNEP